MKIDISQQFKDSIVVDSIRRLKQKAARTNRAAFTATVLNRHHRGRPTKYQAEIVYFMSQGTNPSQSEIINKAKWSYTNRYVSEVLGLDNTRQNIKLQLDKFNTDRSLEVEDIMEL